MDVEYSPRSGALKEWSIVKWRIDDADEAMVAAARPHDWNPFVLGRICRTCLTVQANDEFDDEIGCWASPIAMRR